MKVIHIFYAVLISISLGCQQKDKNNEEKSSLFPAPFANVLKAHGGLDTWNSYGTLQFDEIYNGDTIDHILDLKNRNERMEERGKYIVGFTSDSIYYFLDRSSFPSKAPRFMHNLRFYFFAIPFVTADPGTNHEVLEPRMMQGVDCNRIKVTFGDQVGFAPKDQYILWIGKEDNLLKMINYSVTYYDQGKAENFNAIVYDQWKDIAGLKVPTEMIGYKWENDTLGEERYRKYIGNISFSKDRPSQETFTHLE